MAGHGQPGLRVEVLGAFRVTYGGQNVTDRLVGRSRTIFEYLVITTAPVSRDVLIELCWPGFDPERGRNNLNVAVTGIRKAFGWSGIVQHRAGTYRINPDAAVSVDLREFLQQLRHAQRLDRAGQRAAAIDAYRTTVEHHGSELLPEERYADWLAPHRSFVQHAHLDAIKRLTLPCLDEGDLFGASCAAQLGLLVDELDEELVECWLKTLVDRRAGDGSTPPSPATPSASRVSSDWSHRRISWRSERARRVRSASLPVWHDTRCIS